MEKKIEKKQDELLKIDLITNHSEIAFKKINSNSFQDNLKTLFSHFKKTEEKNKV